MAGAVRRESVAGRRVVLRVLTLTMVAALLVPAGRAAASHYGDTEELAAANAVEAAVAFSQRAFPDGSVQALLGRDDVFADSLASGSLQGNRPLLLTRGDSLSPKTDAELKRLNVRLVHVLGGTAAVSRAVEDQLVTAGYAVLRHKGGSRIETAIEIAKEAAPDATDVILARAFASGTDQSQAFADSLAAGAWAAEELRPILLTETDKLSDATAAYLSGSRAVRLFIVGGQAAISAAAEAQAKALGLTVERVSGPTRFDTAIEVAKKRGMDTGADAATAVLVDGQDAGGWASGFAAAALAATPPAGAIVLSNGDELPAPTEAFLGAAGSTAKLVCAPSAASAACGAAAEEMGKPKLAQVTLDAESVARFARLKGSVAPVSQVASMLGDGCGLSDELVGVDTAGKFEARVTAPEGECQITFTIVSPSGSRNSQTFDVTVTEAAPGTSKPELRKVEIVETTVQHAKVRFIFTEPIDGAPYQLISTPTPPRMDQNDRVSAHGFMLYGPNPSDRFLALGEAYNPPADVDHRPVREFDNPRAVIATFKRADFDKATTAAVSDDNGSNKLAAARDVDTSFKTNAPGSVPLKTVSLPGGLREQKADLQSVSGLTTSGAPAGKFFATFTFDQAHSTTVSAGDHQLVLSDGRVIPGETVDGGGTAATRKVTFAVSATRTPEGTTCADPNCPTVQSAILGARRAVVAASGTTRPLQSVTVTQGGISAGPDLASVSLDLAGKKATFTFDQDITGVVSASTGFGLYSGSATGDTVFTGQNATKTGDRSVTVEFPSLTKLVIGAYVTDNAVTSSAGANAGAGLGISQEFAAGEVLGPTLVGGSAVFVSETNGVRSYSVEWRFDRDIETTITQAKLRVYLRNGQEVAANKISSCTAAGKIVTCAKVDVTHSDDNTLIGLLGVDGVEAATTPAVKLKHDVTALQFRNIEGSIQL